MSSYQPHEVEPRIYQLWEEGGYFDADPDPGRPPYTIVIPPPNVTGALHLGHAINNTLQDILIRMHRMRGYVACWLPGTDHAGIATQAVVEKRVRAEEGKTRHELGREGLLERIWKWKDEYNARILGQLRRMGCSCDWRRTRFTLDEVCARAVYETFFRLFRDGLIYRGLRLVNWDCELQTAVADDEVYHETVRGHLWHVRYPILRSDGEQGAGTRAQGAGGSPPVVSESQIREAVARAASPDAKEGVDYLVVATTRPETMLGDTAVAVHPDDARYQHLIGGWCLLPLMNRPIPIIADGQLVDPTFGTGCVKVTPGHDPNDYACAQRHGLPMINILTADGKINENGRAQGAGRRAQGASDEATERRSDAGAAPRSHVPTFAPSHNRTAEGGCPPSAEGAGRGDQGAGGEPLHFDYVGLDRFEARKRVVADLERLGLLEKVEDYQTEVGHSDRSKSPIEPRLSEQWFVKMDRLAELAMEAVRDGRVRFYPPRFAKTYLDWLSEKRDWCISRQLWWGHRIPVWTVTAERAEEPAVRQLTELLKSEHRDRAVVRRGNGRLYICLENPSDEGCQSLARQLEQAGFVQDEDVLDTWFSSALWPFSTFGWPEPEAVADLLRGGASGTEARRYRKEEATAPAATGGDQSPPADDGGQPPSAVSGGQPPSAVGGGQPPSAVKPCERGNVGTWERGAAGGSDPSVASSLRRSVASDFDYFFPTRVLSTARDIITLWVARMVMMSQYLTRRVPFRHVVIHPTIQDGQGRRMSKSLGNGVDPLDVIEMYGADALRFTLASMAGETQDVRVPVKPAKLPDGRVVNTSERFELGRNFCNKLWQAATGFVIPAVQGVRIERGPHGFHTSRPPAELPLFDRWIRTRANECIRRADQLLRQYRFSHAVDALRALFWGELCDWYIEECKGRVRGDSPEANDAKVVLLQSLDIALCLLHPVIPFVTEQIWQQLNEAVPRHWELIWPDDEPLPERPPALIVAPWPQPWEAADDPQADRIVGEVLQVVIRAVRDVRTRVNAIRSASKQPAVRTLPRAVIRAAGETAEVLRAHEGLLTRLGQVDAVEVAADAERPAQSFVHVLSGAEVYVPVGDLADLEVERQRLRKQMDELAGHIKRVEGKLNNRNFTTRAPAEVVQRERQRLSDLKDKLERLEASLRELG